MQRAHYTRPQALAQALALQFTLAQALVVPWWGLALAQGTTKAHQGLAQGAAKAKAKAKSDAASSDAARCARPQSSPAVGTGILSRWLSPVGMISR